MTTDISGQQITLMSRFHILGSDRPLTVPNSWLVSVRPDGSVGFISIGELRTAPDNPQVPCSINRQFSESDYAMENLDLPRSEMHSALTNAGLFDDEATAMLATWEQAYFQSAGLRLFHVVPRAWTETRLPLTVSVDADITRVMMGRIELVSDCSLLRPS